MFVYFGSNPDNYRVIGWGKDIKHAHMVISEFLKTKNYKSYYWQWYTDPNNITTIDVGSWSEFFKVSENLIADWSVFYE